jgi:hypothetical protein
VLGRLGKRREHEETTRFSLAGFRAEQAADLGRCHLPVRQAFDVAFEEEATAVAAAAHAPRCICYSCRRARAGAERRAKIRPRVVVASDETAARIAELRASGRSLRSIARDAGLSPAVIVKASRPNAGLDDATARAILALR